jgi:hypothetical protein
MTPLLLLLATPAAHALDVRWWGVGPGFGTRVVPLAYPIYPKMADDTGFPKVEGNFEVAVHAVAYADKVGRVALRGELGGNFDTWGSQEFTVGWDQLLVKEGELQLLLGGGIGVGHERTARDSGESFLYWDVQYFPVRAQIGGLLRDHWRAYEIDIWGTWHIVGAQELCTSADDCTAPPTIGDSLGFYGGVGLEATVYFGSFASTK